MPTVKFNSEDLNKTAQKFRKELLIMPVMALGEYLKYMSLRPGIRYSETVGEMNGDIQFGPYSETRVDDNDIVVNPRTLYTFFGSVVKNFSPNKIYSTMWGSDITKGEGLKTTEITRTVLSYLSALLGKNLAKVLFTAVRKDDGTLSKDLFNGFDTIASKEMIAGNLAADKGNLFVISKIDKTNAVDVIKSIARAAADELLNEQALNLLVPRHVFYDYCDDYKSTSGSVPYNKEFNQYYVEGFNNVTIVPMSNKKDSPFIQLTPAKNMLVGVNQTGEEENIEVARFAAFVLQFIATMFFGCEYESISKERLLIATIDGKLAV